MNDIEVGMSGAESRAAFNGNIDEIDPVLTYGQLPIWQRINIEEALVRIPGYFRTGSSQAKNFATFAFPDTHYNKGGSAAAHRLALWDRVSYFLSLINKDNAGDELTNIHNAIVAGDIIARQGSPTQAQAIAGIVDCSAKISGFPVDLFFTTGNHDFNSEYSTSADIVLSNQDLYDNLFSVMRSNIADIVMPENKCYWYKDYVTDDFKIRFIGLNICEWPEIVDGSNNYLYGHTGDAHGTTLGYISEDQAIWLMDEALNLPSSDYQVVLYAHDSSIPWQIINAFVTNGSVTYAVNEGDANLDYSVTRNFATINGFAGIFTANFSGHGHIPRTRKDTYYETYWDIMNPGGYGADGFFRYADSDMCDVNIIDAANRKIIIGRYGLAQAPDGTGLPFGDRGIAADDLIEY